MGISNSPSPFVTCRLVSVPVGALIAPADRPTPRFSGASSALGLLVLDGGFRLVRCHPRLLASTSCASKAKTSALQLAKRLLLRLRPPW